ncbi:DHH family phosphoesterase [Candidatus Bathyarchaeota archaeon]|nr:MAG: DHH family phosphoesterase [Candidatus Bathyarchaeota archaeon]
MQPRSSSDGDKLARLHKQASETASLIREKASDDTILLASHFDADGISAGSIMLSAVNRLGSVPHLRIIDSVNERILDQIEAIESDLVIFTDIGSGYLEIISKILRNRDIVVADHHQPLGEPGSNLHHFNTHILGFDGSEEISGAGTAYLLAKALDSRNTDLSAMAIVGALGDQQDKGPERRFKGLNADILKDAVESKVIEVTKDLIFFGRQTRPIHRAIASTTDPFLPGLSGEEDRCLALLDAAGIPTKVDDRWRTISDLSLEEKSRIVDKIIEHTISSKFPGEIVLNLIGSVYTLTREEPGTSLRDAREFATLLNSCGRMNRAGLGIAIGIGDRGESYQEAQQLYSEYKTQLSKYMNWVATAPNATRTGKNVVIVNGKGIIDESMTGAVSSLISSSKLFGESKVTVVTTLTRSGEAKVSTRATEQLVQKGVNLGKILQNLSPKYGGIGGGHAIAAGATIPSSELDRFLRDLEKSLDEMLA